MLLKKKIFSSLTLSLVVAVGGTTIVQSEAKAVDNETIKTNAGTNVTAFRDSCYNEVGEENEVNFEVTHQPLVTFSDHSQSSNTGVIAIPKAIKDPTIELTNIHGISGDISNAPIKIVEGNQETAENGSPVLKRPEWVKNYYGSYQDDKKSIDESLKDFYMVKYDGEKDAELLKNDAAVVFFDDPYSEKKTVNKYEDHNKDYDFYVFGNLYESATFKISGKVKTVDAKENYIPVFSTNIGWKTIGEESSGSYALGSQSLREYDWAQVGPLPPVQPTSEEMIKLYDNRYEEELSPRYSANFSREDRNPSERGDIGVHYAETFKLEKISKERNIKIGGQAAGVSNEDGVDVDVVKITSCDDALPHNNKKPDDLTIEEEKEQDKWNSILTCKNIYDEEFKKKLEEVGEVHAYIPSDLDENNYKSYFGQYINPTEEEMNNFEEVSWDTPGDYTYLVENLPEDQRPRLMRVKGTDKYFIETTMKKRDSDKKTTSYYRSFDPNNYLPKNLVEWKEDPITGKKYNSKLITGKTDSLFPYDKENGEKRPQINPDIMPPKGATNSERLEFFLEHDDIFTVDTTYKNPAVHLSSKFNLGDEYEHNEIPFNSCGPLVSIKPSSIENDFYPYKVADDSSNDNENVEGVIIGSEPGTGNGAKDLGAPMNFWSPASVGITVRKTDNMKQFLSGSTWKIKNLGTGEEFTVTDNKQADPNDPSTLSDIAEEEGIINADLPEGKYEMVETVAPQGYLIDDTPRKFIIHDKTGKQFNMGDIVNIKPGMLHLKKVDPNGKPLSGSVWKIVDKDSGKEYMVEDDSSGDILKGDKLTELGKDILADPGNIDIPLPPGNYTVEEVKAPEGYELDDTVREAVLDPETGNASGIYEDYLGEIVNEPTDPPTTETTTPPTTKTTTPTTETTTPPTTKTTTTTTKTSTPPTAKTTTPKSTTSETTPNSPGIQDTPETESPIFTPVRPGVKKTPTQVSTPNKNRTTQPRHNETISDPKVDTIDNSTKVDTGGKVKDSFIGKIRNIFS